MKQTLEDFLDHLQYVRGLAKLTLVAYRNDLEHCFDFLSSINVGTLEEVTSEHLIQHLTRLRERGYADTSLLRHAACLKTFFAWLLDENRIRQNPTDCFPAGQRAQHLPRTIDETRLGKLLDAIDGNQPIDLRDRAVLELLYGCGLRCAELCGLTLHDIDFESNHVRIFGKGRRERLVPFGTPARKALLRYLQWRNHYADAPERKKTQPQLNAPDAPFFLSPRGKPLQRAHLSAIVRKRIRVNLPDAEAARVTPHVLRHAFATHLLDHGAPLMDIRDLLGHASVTTTQLYTHISTQHLQQTFRSCFPRAKQ